MKRRPFRPVTGAAFLDGNTLERKRAAASFNRLMKEAERLLSDDDPDWRCAVKWTVAHRQMTTAEKSELARCGDQVRAFHMERVPREIYRAVGIERMPRRPTTAWARPLVSGVRSWADTLSMPEAYCRSAECVVFVCRSVGPCHIVVDGIGARDWARDYRPEFMALIEGEEIDLFDHGEYVVRSTAPRLTGPEGVSGGVPLFGVDLATAASGCPSRPRHRG